MAVASGKSPSRNGGRRLAADTDTHSVFLTLYTIFRIHIFT